MAGGRQGKRTRNIGPIERGGLGSGMMSDDGSANRDVEKAERAPADAGAAIHQGGEAGAPLDEELEKVDRDALKR